MNELDKMLDAPGETVLPLLVRYCKSRKEAGDRIEVELYRPDSAGGLSRTDLVIHRWEQEKEQEPRHVEWDDGVNAGLVDLGITRTGKPARAEPCDGEGFEIPMESDGLAEAPSQASGQNPKENLGSRHTKAPRAGPPELPLRVRQTRTGAIGRRAATLPL